MQLLSNPVALSASMPLCFPASQAPPPRSVHFVAAFNLKEKALRRNSPAGVVIRSAGGRPTFSAIGWPCGRLRTFIGSEVISRQRTISALPDYGKMCAGLCERVLKRVTAQRHAESSDWSLGGRAQSRAVCDRLLAVGIGNFRSFTLPIGWKQALHFQGPGVAVGP